MPTWPLLPSWHSYPSAVPCGHLLRQVSFLVLMVLICIFLPFLSFSSTAIYYLLCFPTVSLSCSPIRLIRHISGFIIKASGLFSLGQGCRHQGPPAELAHSPTESLLLSLYRLSIGQESSCTACPSGYYCRSAGLTAPSGPCSAGYYCLSGASSPSPPGELPWVNVSVST